MDFDASFRRVDDSSHGSCPKPPVLRLFEERDLRVILWAGQQMAEWRERGYVPDSDEEDEDIIQGVITKLNSSIQERVQDRLFAGDNISSLDIRETSTETPQQGGLLNSILGDDESHGSNDRLYDIHDPIPKLSNEVQQTSLPTTAEKLESELQHGLDTVRQALRIQPPPAADSGMSSLSSSPLSSLHSSTVGSPIIEKPDLGNNDHVVEPVPVSITHSYPLISETTRLSRQLRHRTQLQLNPYSLENAQFQQVLKQRGLAPIRVPKAFDDRHLGQANDESQGTEVAWSSQAGSSPQPRRSISPPNNGTEEESQSPIRGQRMTKKTFASVSDDELPDLSQILQGTEPLRTQSSTIPKANRRSLNGVKRGRSSLAKERYHVYRLPKDNHGRQIQDEVDQSIFDLPPSPPRSLAMESPTISTSQQSDGTFQFQQTPELLPTPILSSDRQGQKRSLVEVSSSSGSNRGSDSLDEASSSSESTSSDDDSPRAVNIQKRIRGVLPASWLKLDLQQQSARTKAKPFTTSPKKTLPDKGVAQRVTSSSARQKSTSYPFDHSNTFADAEVSSSGSSEEKEERNNDFRGPPGVDDVHGEAEEDNTIDVMLPKRLQALHRRKTERKKQQKLDQTWKTAERRRNPSNELSKIAPRPRSRSKLEYMTKGYTKSRHNRKRPKRQHGTQQLTVMDAPGFVTPDRQEQPQFLKVAARQGGRRSQIRSQDMSRKFFQLATWNDTADINKDIHTLQKKRKKQTKRHPVLTNRIRTRLSPLVAQRRFEPGRRDDCNANSDLWLDSREIVNTLKKKTATTLDNLHLTNVSTTEHLPSSALQRTKPLLHSSHGLLTSFSRGNRAGRGEFLTQTKQRVAQLEGPQVRPPYTHLAIRRLLPRSAGSEFQSLDSGMGTPPEGVARPLTPIPTHSNHPRKHGPRKTVLKEKLSYRPRTRQLPSEDRRTSIVDMASDMALIHRILCTETSFLSSTVIGRGLLAQACNCIDELLNPGGMKDSDREKLVESTVIITLPENLETSLVVPSSINAAELIRRVINETTIMVSKQPTDQATLAERFLSPDKQSCFRCLDGVLMCLNQCLLYNDVNDWEPFAQILLAALEDFLDAATKAESGQGIENSLQWLRAANCMVIFAHQMKTIGEAYLSRELESRCFDLCNRLLTLIICLSLQPRRIGEVLNRVMLICDKQPGLDIAGLDDTFPEIETIVILHHMLAVATTDGMSVFQSFMSTQVNNVYGESVAQKLAYTILIYRIFIPLMHLDINGRFQRGVFLEDWPLLGLFLGEFLELHVRVGEQISPTHRRLGLTALKFCHMLVSNRMWRDPDDLFKILFAAYSEHSMRNLFFDTRILNPDFRHGRDFPFTFIHMYDTDFEIFVKMVAIHLKRKHDTWTKLEEESKPLNIAPMNIVQQKFLAQKPPLDPAQLVQHKRNLHSQIRSLVFSILPNNSKTFSEDEDLSILDLHAMENIYLMYEVVYSNVPPNCRPRPSQIENLIDYPKSHMGICELTLQCWSHLAAFAVNRVDCLNDVAELASWMERMVLSLVDKVANIRANTLGQLTKNNLAFGHQAEQNVRQNSAVVSGMITETIRSWTDSVSRCELEIAAASMMFTNSFERIINISSESKDLGDAVIPSICNLVLEYLKKPIHEGQGGDLPMHNRIQAPLRMLISSCLQSVPPKSGDLLEALSNTWFKLAHTFVKEKFKNWDDYLTAPAPLSFAILADTESSRQCKVLFVSEIIREDDMYFILDRDFFYAAWIEALLQPEGNLTFEHHLTKQMILSDPDTLALNRLTIGTRNNKGELSLTLEELKLRRVDIIKHLIRYIYNVQFKDDIDSQDFLESNFNAAQGKMLLNVMTATMKASWRKTSELERSAYTTFCYSIISELEIFKYKGFSIDSWFIDPQEIEFPKKGYQIREFFFHPAGSSPRFIDATFLTSLRTGLVKCLVQKDQQAWSEELTNALSLTNPDMIDEDGNALVDTGLQMQVMQHVLPEYITRSMHSEPHLLLAMPLIAVFQNLYDRFQFQINYDDPDTVDQWIVLSLVLLSTIRDALHNRIVYPIPRITAWHLVRAQLFSLASAVLQLWIQLATQSAQLSGSILNEEDVRSMALWIYKGGAVLDINEHPMDYFEPELGPEDRRIRDAAAFELTRSVRDDWRVGEGGEWVVRVEGVGLAVPGLQMAVNEAEEQFPPALEDLEGALRAMGMIE